MRAISVGALLSRILNVASSYVEMTSSMDSGPQDQVEEPAATHEGFFGGLTDKPAIRPVQRISAKPERT